MCMVLIQSQEGGGPGNQRGSSTGAAGPGHEPQPAHLPGPGCRAHPGEGKVMFYVHFFWRHQSSFPKCRIISSNIFGEKIYLIWSALRISALNQPLLSLAGGVRVPHCPGHHGWRGDGEQCHWKSEAALRGSNPQWGRHGSAVPQCEQQRAAFPSSRESLGMQECNNLYKRPKDQGKRPNTRKPTLSAICFPFILCLSRLVGRREQEGRETGSS